MAGTYTKLIFHVIFSTKNREPLITPRLREKLYPYIGGIVRGRVGSLLEIGGMPDHLHLVIRTKPDTSISEAVRLVKANSSKWINEQEQEQTAGSAGRFGWQSGYGAFSVSLSQASAVRDYVRTQEEHHRVRSFREEYVEFLRRHEVAFDEQHLWG